MLAASHWSRDRGITFQQFHWSTAVWASAAKLYFLRGGFDDSVVGMKKIPSEQGSSQSCDKEHVAVEFVVDLHCLSYSAEYFDVVSVYCEDLHGAFGGVLHDALLLVG